MNLKIIILCIWCFSWTLGNTHNAPLSELNKDLLEHINGQQVEKNIYKRLAEVITKGKRREWSHSNHPPLDASEDIPVRVVYEGEEAASESSINNNSKRTRSRGNKKHRINTSSTKSTEVSTESKILLQNNENITLSSTEIPKLITTTNKVNIHSTSVTYDQSSNEKNIPRRTKINGHAKNIEQVPVSIIYDDTLTKTKTENINKLANDTTTEKQIETLDKAKKIIETDISKVTDKNIPIIPTTEKRTKTLNNNYKAVITTPQTIDESKILVSRNTVTEKHADVTNNIKGTTQETTTIKIITQKTISNNENGKSLEQESIQKSEIKSATNSQESNSSSSDVSKQSEKNTRKSKLVRQRDPIVPIIENTNNIYAHIGKFDYSYEGGDGTKSFQSGVLKENNQKLAGEAVVGGFSYKDKDGQNFELSYTADENGYRPVGAHLPTPPPVPAAIARALLYLATKTTPAPVTKSMQDLE